MHRQMWNSNRNKEVCVSVCFTTAGFVQLVAWLCQPSRWPTSTQTPSHSCSELRWHLSKAIVGHLNNGNFSIHAHGACLNMWICELCIKSSSNSIPRRSLRMQCALTIVQMTLFFTLENVFPFFLFFFVATLCVSEIYFLYENENSHHSPYSNTYMPFRRTRDL